MSLPWLHEVKSASEVWPSERWRFMVPFERGSQPDPYPALIDDLIATLNLHGTANERAIIHQWARERYRQ